MPLPLQPIPMEALFHQWGLYFIDDIHPASSAQHKWILTGTDYFIKWIESLLRKQATNLVVIQFLENILFRFGYPRRIINDNAQCFNSKKMVKFYQDYHITLSHSATYYPQDNGLAEYSNKSLAKIIKKLLEDNKKAWHTKLKFIFWENRVNTKRSINTSPFQLVYGIDALFPFSIGIPIMKYLQELGEEPNELQKRIN